MLHEKSTKDNFILRPSSQFEEVHHSSNNHQDNNAVNISKTIEAQVDNAVSNCSISIKFIVSGYQKNFFRVNLQITPCCSPVAGNINSSAATDKYVRSSSPASISSNSIISASNQTLSTDTCNCSTINCSSSVENTEKTVASLDQQTTPPQSIQKKSAIEKLINQATPKE